MLVNGLVIQQYAIKNNSLAGVAISDPAQAIPIWKALWVVTQLKNPSFAFTRFSLLALFLRLFRTKLIRWTCYFLIAFVVAQTVAYNIAGTFQCVPVDYFWTAAYHDGRKGSCFDYNMFYRALVPPEIFVDIVLIFLPLPEIWKLKSNSTRKWGLTTLFLSGALALMSNCVRLSSYWRHTIDGAVPSVLNAIVAWCNSEMSCCFIVACLPTMHPLFQRLLPTSLRERIQQRMRMGRHGPAQESIMMSASSGASGGFRRLMENSGTATPGFGEPQRFDAQAVGTGDSSKVERWGDIKGGEGIMVKTEVIVTQEELIEDVLGF